MNKDIIEGKLKEFSGEVRKKWGQLTDDEVQKTKGNAEALSGLVQQKFGMSKEKASAEVGDFFNSFEKKYSSKLNEKIDSIKSKIGH